MTTPLPPPLSLVSLANIDGAPWLRQCALWWTTLCRLHPISLFYLSVRIIWYHRWQLGTIALRSTDTFIFKLWCWYFEMTVWVNNKHVWSRAKTSACWTGRNSGVMYWFGHHKLGDQPEMGLKFQKNQILVTITNTVLLLDQKASVDFVNLYFNMKTKDAGIRLSRSLRSI